MLVFEILADVADIQGEISSAFPESELQTVDSLDGSDLIQVLVPLASVVMPVVSQILQKYWNDNRVTIKYDGIEISALGYEKAMRLLKEVLAQRESEKKHNASD